MYRYHLQDIEWGKFKISNIFTVEKVIGKPIENYSIGNIPYISTASTNNAVVNFVYDINSVSTGNTISVDPIKGSCFYHEYKFVGRGFSGASVNLLRTDKLNKYNAIFCCSVIQKTAMEKASYGYLFNSDRLKNGIILLPIDQDGNPNWHFMEEYIKEREEKKRSYLLTYYRDKLCDLVICPEVLTDVKWGEFFVSDVFDTVQRGKRLTKVNQIYGETPYISSTSLNNGVDNFIGNIENIRKSDHDLTLANSGSVGACFYHDYEYIASDHVTSLKLLNGYDTSYKFMSVILARLEGKYSFNREINDTRIKREKLLLPIDKDGNPNWSYMENFIKNIEQKKIKEIIKYLNKYIYI